MCLGCDGMGGVGGEWGDFVQGLGSWDVVMSGFFVEMAGPGSCVLCSADTYAS